MESLNLTLKSGESIVIRLASPVDAADLLAMKLGYLKDSTTIPLNLNEYPNDQENESQLINRLTTEKNSVLIVAENNNQLIGNIDLNGNQRSKLFHTGFIGMGIKEEWRGEGVGKALMQTVIDWSKQNQFISILWLEVYDTNIAGKKLYKNMGFKVCGRIENFFQEANQSIDKITMVRHL